MSKKFKQDRQPQRGDEGRYEQRRERSEREQARRNARRGKQSDRWTEQF